MTPLEGAVANRTFRHRFKRFRESDTSLEGRSRLRCPLQSNIERIKVLLEDSPSLITRELSAMLDCNQSTIDRHLHDRHRFLQQIVTGNEKSVLYVDHICKGQWIDPEDLPEIRSKE